MSTPVPIVVTEELRRAVYDADCQRLGHVPDISQAISTDPIAGITRIDAPDDDTLPHFFCRRCGKVWLIHDPAVSYDAAETDLNDKLKPEFHRPPRTQVRDDVAAQEDAAATAAEAAAAKARADAAKAKAKADAAAPKDREAAAREAAIAAAAANNADTDAAAARAKADAAKAKAKEGRS